jgi:Carbohydrate family 9 binding domain-like
MLGMGGRQGGGTLGVVLCALVVGSGELVAQAPAETIPGDVRRYTAYRAPSSGLSMDGRLTEPAWQAAPWTEPFVDIRGEPWAEPTWETAAKILWDEEFLYVAAYLVEPQIWATLRNRDAIIYRDHDFEVFLNPEGDGVRYFEFEVNAFGTLLDLYLDRPYNDGGKADLQWNAMGARWAVAVDGSVNDPDDEDRGWSVEIAIPWTSLIAPGSEEARGPPADGDVWRVNFSRVQWPLKIVDGRYQKVREPVDWNDHPEDNWVWSPQGIINMHVPERWGAVTFRDVPPREGRDTYRGGV